MELPGPCRQWTEPQDFRALPGVSGLATGMTGTGVEDNGFVPALSAGVSSN